MKPLDTKELNTIRSIVNGHWTNLGISAYGSETMGGNNPEILELVRSGVITQQAATLIDPIADAYLFGHMQRKLAQMGTDVENLSLDEFYTEIKRDPVPLSDAENAAIKYAKKWAGQYTRTITERSAGHVIARIQQVDNELFVADKQSNFIGESTTRAIKERWSVDALTTKLRQESGDVITDWDRVAGTELQNAHENGAADDIQGDYGPDARVAKLVNPNACKWCKLLYLDDNGIPKIFKLAELRANGDNVGKKKADWLPTLGVVHPNCFCSLIYVPDNYEFDDAGNLARKK